MSDESFFTPLENTKPYLKVAFMGFAGSGKTHTAALMAEGLHKRIESTKPIAIFDSEKAAKFLAPIFRASGIGVLHKESRSLADLKETLKRCREGAADILLIDSLSHVWEHFLTSYREKKRRDRMEMQDWGVVKPLWKAEFADPFVRDPVHIIMTGRAGYEYENEKDDQGKRQIYKSGVKMKVEGETAYEPDLIVLMERFEELLDKEKKKVWREATVIKDRSTKIDGKTFRNPTYADFAPMVDAVLEAPSQRPEAVEGDTGALIQTDEDRYRRKRDKSIVLEKIEAALVAKWPGQSAEHKKAKTDALYEAFGTRSWTEISERLGMNVLEAGLGYIERENAA